MKSKKVLHFLAHRIRNTSWKLDVMEEKKVIFINHSIILSLKICLLYDVCRLSLISDVIRQTITKTSLYDIYSTNPFVEIH